ncbi:sodium:calcium antiporter [Patescibacteria group bacterium]|nr:sodium:calcium antiporter [Patescibacteria group bacterium]
MEPEILKALILFVLGLYILVKGADILIRGSVSVAKIFKVSNWFVAIVIAGIGTSIPEMSVVIASALAGNDIGLAALAGTNIFNMLVIIGFISIISPLVIKPIWISRDFMIALGAIIISVIFIFFPVLGDEAFLGVTALEALVLIALLFVWFLFMFYRSDTSGGEEAEPDFEIFTILTSALLILGGILGVFIGGNWVVDGAEVLALALGITPAIVGFTVVAIGTSLPELTVSVVSLIQGRTSIAIGNILGSTTFNFLGILGIAGLITPIAVVGDLFSEFIAVIVSMLILLVAIFIGKRYRVGRIEGITLILLYVAYIVYIFVI